MKVRVRPHKRGHGKWSVDFYCPITGRRKYESYATKQQATRRKKELEGKSATGEYLPAERKKWKDFLAEYQAKILSQQKPKTRAAYAAALESFDRVCRIQMLQRITTKTIDQFRAARALELRAPDRSKPVSPATINKELRCIRVALRTANRWGYLPILPEFRMLKVPPTEPRAISPALFDRLLNATDRLNARPPVPGPQWWRAFLSTAYLAGLRLGELLALRWRDVSFAGGELCVRNRKAGRIESVPMAERLARQLRCWMSGQPGDAIKDAELVFPITCHERTLSSAWGRLQKLARIERPYRLHDLRISYCTNLVASGVEAATLKSLARHQSLTTTLKYYRARTADADRRAIARMEAQLENKMENVRQSPDPATVTSPDRPTICAHSSAG